MNGRKLGDDGAKIIAEGIAFVKPHHALILDRMDLAKLHLAITEAMAQNKKLRMALANPLLDGGIVALANYLKTDTKITTLNINSCSFGDDGAKLWQGFKIEHRDHFFGDEQQRHHYEGSTALAPALARTIR